MSERFLRFTYAAIKRYGDRTWTAHTGTIEFNPSYTVSCSKCEKGKFGNDLDVPYIIELSNGTKFLCFINDYWLAADNLLSGAGETANRYADPSLYDEVKRSIEVLNSYR